MRLGTLPPLAAAFNPRPETGLGLAGSLVPGELTVLSPAPDEGNPDPLAPMGGTGKTQLAAALAHSLWQAGAVEALLWLTASSRDALIAGYARALSDLGIAEPGIDPAEAGPGSWPGWPVPPGPGSSSSTISPIRPTWRDCGRRGPPATLS